MNNLFGRSTLVGALLGVAVASQAFTLNFDGLHTGTTPGGPAPWASLTITDAGVNTVNFTLTHSATSTAGQFLTELWLNMAPYPSSPAIVESSPKITGASFSNNGINNASLNFDASVEFATSNSGGGALRLKPGESESWQITGAGLTAASFLNTSPSSNVYAMLHIQGLANGQSGKIIATVPEPASMSALALAIGGMLARRKRKAS